MRSDLKIRIEDGINSLDFISRFRPELIRRITNALILIDLLQEIVFIMTARTLTKLGFYVLIEDFSPTIKLEHDLFLRLYTKQTQSNEGLIKKILDLLNRIVYRIYPVDSVCVFLQAQGATRSQRSARRGYRAINPSTLEDQNREKNLESLSRMFCQYCVVVNTDELSIRQVFEKVQQGLRRWRVIEQ